ncbi:putative ribonuclease H-like domain-containing protein [Tanacetum coccineum]
MDLETAQTTATTKLPILKQGEYDMWRLRIEQYFQVQDYALWDVIDNGNSFKLVAQTTTNADGTSTLLIPSPYKDAKTLFAAIQTRFGGNEATKKTQKTLLKQMYKNFSAPSIESQCEVSWLSLRNKTDLNTMSFDDLYNNFKIVEQEVKGTANSSSSSSSQNMAFVSSPSSTNELNTAYGVSTANTQVSPTSTQVSTASTQVSTANLSDDTVYAFLAIQPNGSQLIYEDLEQIHEDEIKEMDLKCNTAGYDKSKVECLNCHKIGHFASYMADDEVPTNMALMAFSDSEITDKSRKGVGFISYNAVPPPPTRLFSPLNLDLSYSGLEEFHQPEFEGYGPKPSKSVSKDTSNEVRESPNTPLVKELALDDKLEKKTVFPTVAKIEFVKHKQQEKPVRKLVKYAEMYRPKVVNTARPNSTVVNAMRENQVNAIKALACWVWRPTKLNSALITLKRHNYVDARGRSKHMTGNMSYLSNIKEFDRGYVTFGGRAKGGKITGKETLKTSQELENNALHRRLGESNTKALLSPSSELIRQPLFMLHMDLFGLTFVSSLMNKKYCLVVTDDYSRFTWVFILATKDETSGILKSVITEKENLVDKKVKKIICDNGTEFKNKVMTDSKLPTTFWAKVVNTTSYVQNRVLVVKPHNKTPYELFRGRTPALSFMRPFGCYVTILNTIDNLGKFNGKSDEGFFIRYSLNSKDFRVYNIRAMKVEENLHIRFLEDKPIIIGTNSNDLIGTEENIGVGHSSKETRSSQDYIVMPLWKDDSLFDSSLKNASNNEPQPSSDAEKINDEGVNKESGIDDQKRPKNSTQDVNTARPKLDMSNITTTYPVPFAPNTRIHKDHSLNHVIGDVQYGVLTRRMIKTTNEQGFISAVNEGKTHEDLYTCRFACFLSQEEPKKVIQALKDPSWIEAISAVQVTTDERGIVIRNKARLVTQGYTQEEGIDYDKVFAPVARIKVNRLFLVYASFKDFVVYQMDVKSAFLYGKIEEEFYVYQPLGFEDPEFPDRRGQIDKNLFIKRVKSDILLVQVYVDDIIFGSTKRRLQVTQKDDGIFINQDKYVDEILKKFCFLTVKTSSTPMETSKPLIKDENAEDINVHLYRFNVHLYRSMIGSLMYLTSLRPDVIYLKGQPKLGHWYPKDPPFDLKAYSDSDYDDASLDRKSTTGGCQFFISRLISWQCKKQTVVANSTTKAEYVAATSCYGQVLLIQNQMLDYGYIFMNTKIFIDKESTICIVKNPVFHSKTKHIEIWHHFIKDSNEKKLIQMIKIHTDQNVVDLLTKAFDVGRFQYMITSIGMLNL